LNQEIYIRVDIMGDSDAKQETKETRCRSWAFEATFALEIHPALATDCNSAATAYIRNVLDMEVVKGMNFLSLAIPSNRSDLSRHGSVHVTDVLNGRTTTRS
jgi:hypothetical protein